MILVAGVGYHHLSDLSFGPLLVERLQDMDWPEEVHIEDFSYGPIALLHWFEESPGKRFERAILAGAVERGREPGTLSTYPWSTVSPSDPEEVQARVSEALTGVISLENLLIIAQYFEMLPADTLVVELEPVVLEWGMDLSPQCRERREQAAQWIHRDVHSASENSCHKEVRNG